MLFWLKIKKKGNATENQKSIQMFFDSGQIDLILKKY